MTMGRPGRRRSDVDRREEALSHIRIEADRLEAEGVPPAEAMRRARRAFGRDRSLDPTDTGRGRWLETLGRDVRHAVRKLVAAPASTLTIMASLAIGIGTATAIFSLADQALVRALPVEDPDRVVQLRWDGHFVGGGRGYGSLIPHPLYAALSGEQSVFAAMAARSPGEISITTPAGSERAAVELVTGGYFDLLGVRPFLGRLVDEGDNLVLAGHPVVVLSHPFWRSRFGADSAVVGREVRINARTMTVVGVAPPGFGGTDWSSVAAAWLPMSMNPVVHDWGRLDEHRVRFQHVFARLAPGVSRAEAEAALAPWFERWIRADMSRATWPAGLPDPEVDAYLASRLAVDPGGQGDAARAADLRQPMIILTAATALLLFLACLNVANLSLARAVTRHRETAVQRALGASRARLMAERMAEAGLLALVGGTLGVLFAPVAGRWILFYMEGGAAGTALSPAVDGRALATALATAVVVTLLSGAGPAWFAASIRPMGALRPRTGGSATGLALRRGLVVGQVALALVLLVGAGLFGRTLDGLRSRGPGFETSQLLAFTVAPAWEGYAGGEAKALMGVMLERLESLPGVTRAGVAAYPMLEGGGWGNAMLVQDEQTFVTDLSLPMNAVSPGFFETLGVAITQGRGFASSDRWDEEGWRLRSVVVSQSFVDRYLPGRDPLGVRVDFGGDPSRVPTMEIVGVVEDFSEQRLRDPSPAVYFALWERHVGEATVYLRADRPLAAVAPAVRAAVAEIDGSLTVAGLRTMDQQIDRLLAFERMLAGLATAFAVFATLLAGIGVYGVMSFAARSRTREVGIRLALGAPRTGPFRLVVGQAAFLAAVGVALALPAVWLLGRTVESQLFGVAPLDPVVLVGAALILIGVCISAGAVPAWRTTRTDPAEALRAE